MYKARSLTPILFALDTPFRSNPLGSPAVGVAEHFGVWGEGHLTSMPTLLPSGSLLPGTTPSSPA